MIHEPLPYEEPEEVIPEELQVQGETEDDISEDDIDDVQPNEDGQITLF